MITDKEIFVVRSAESRIVKTIPLDRGRDFDHVVVLSASIPKTFYALPRAASLTIDEDGAETVVTLQPGNYNVNSLVLILAQAIVSAGATNTYTLSYPNVNRERDAVKYTFTASATTPCSWTTGDSFLANMLGLHVDETAAFTSGVLESPKVLNFQSYDELLIKSNIVQNRESLLQEIYTTGSPYNSSILHETHDVVGHSRQINRLASNVYTFELLDVDGNSVDLNGGEWSFVLMFFRLDSPTKLIADYIGYRLERDEIEDERLAERNEF